MKFAIYHASDDYEHGTKSFTTIDQLINFMERQEHGLIIDDNPLYNEQPSKEFKITQEMTECKYTITIYDDYIE